MVEITPENGHILFEDLVMDLDEILRKFEGTKGFEYFQGALYNTTNDDYADNMIVGRYGRHDLWVAYNYVESGMTFRFIPNLLVDPLLIFEVSYVEVTTKFDREDNLIFLSGFRREGNIGSSIVLTTDKFEEGDEHNDLYSVHYQSTFEEGTIESTYGLDFESQLFDRIREPRLSVNKEIESEYGKFTFQKHSSTTQIDRKDLNSIFNEIFDSIG